MIDSKAFRIVQVVPAIAEESSGPSYSVVRLSESIRDLGANITLACMDWAPLANPPSMLRTFPMNFGPRKLGRSTEMKRWLNNGALRGEIDLIHNHGMWQMNSIYPSIATRKAGLPLVTSPRGSFSEWAMAHGSIAKKVFWPLLQHRAVAASSCFHATAEHEYSDIRRLGFQQPVAIIPNGIDVPEYLPKTLKAGNTLLYLGRLHPVKGLENLLRAWANIEDVFPFWQLDLVGSDDTYGTRNRYGARLRVLVQELSLKRVNFIGELKGKAKSRAYSDASLFVLPSYSENFGVAVAEALACGTPAIVTKGAPWSDLESNQAGWHIDIGVEPLTRCLREVLATDCTSLAQMGLNGREWMLREFSWNRIAAKMLEVYRWLLEPSLEKPICVRID